VLCGALYSLPPQAGNTTALYYGLDVMTELVARSVSDAWNAGGCSLLPSLPTTHSRRHTEGEPPAALQVILSQLGRFVDLLRQQVVD
jgi:hypothetical protein